MSAVVNNGSIGFCRRGPFAGHWVAGPPTSAINEQVIASSSDPDELFSWSWDFQPPRAEYQISEPLSARRALEVITSWDPSWCSPEAESVAEEVIFDAGNTRASLGERILGKAPAIKPADVQLDELTYPVKVQSVQFARALDVWGERTQPPRYDATSEGWVQALGHELGGHFVITPRVGVLVAITDGDATSPMGSFETFRRPPEPLPRESGSVVSLARKLSGTLYCLAFIPSGLHVCNDLDPSEPWAWLGQLRP